MKKTVLHITFVIALLASALKVAAQPAVLPVWVPEGQSSNQSGSSDSGEDVRFSLPEMSIMDVQGPEIIMSFLAASNGGSPISEIISGTSWLNYTSVVSEESTNKISAHISRGSVPDGTTLKLAVAENTGNGNGGFGETGGVVTLSTLEQDVVTNIRSCYTGTGTGNGRQISYTWVTDPTKYAVLSAGQKSVTITYTITSVVPGQ